MTVDELLKELQTIAPNQEIKIIYSWRNVCDRCGTLTVNYDPEYSQSGTPAEITETVKRDYDHILNEPITEPYAIKGIKYYHVTVDAMTPFCAACSE